MALRVTTRVRGIRKRLLAVQHSSQTPPVDEKAEIDFIAQ